MGAEPWEQSHGSRVVGAERERTKQDSLFSAKAMTPPRD